MPVAVNVSAVQFRQDGFCEMIQAILRDTKLDARFLELELTDSVLLSNEDVMFGVLAELKSMGVNLAIDGLGEDPSKRVGVHVRRSQDGFVQILAGAGVVVVISEDVDLC